MRGFASITSSVISSSFLSQPLSSCPFMSPGCGSCLWSDSSADAPTASYVYPSVDFLCCTFTFGKRFASPGVQDAMRAYQGTMGTADRTLRCGAMNTRHFGGR